MDQQRKISADDLAAEASSGYEAIVSWSPGNGRPVSIFQIRVNGVPVAHDELDNYSPFIAPKLPPPDAAGRFTVDFTVKPEVDIDVLVVSIRNRATGKDVVVDKKENPDRVDPWISLGAKVNAP